jgi:uncharacterized protein (TIGR02186 family)
MSGTKAIGQMVGLIIALFVAFWQPQLAMGITTDFRLVPNDIHVSASFRGAPITISGEIPKGANALVEITGPTKVVHLLRKGRRGGLWMSVGEVEVSGAPSLYLMASTDPNLPTGSENKGEWGYAALAKEVSFAGAVYDDKKPALFSQFTKLKESQGLYGMFPGALHVMPAANGSSMLQGQLMLPSNVAPGTYEVTFSVFNSGKLLHRQSVPLLVDMRGIAAFLEKLATNHGVLYGLLAVGIALVIGFGMGFVFKGKSAH